MDIKTIPTSDIRPPNRSDKLHPYEDEDGDEWEEFKESVGTQPQKPIEVVKNGDGYEIIDGDRRFRALNENNAEEVECFVRSPDEVEDFAEKRLMMIQANEFREPSNRSQRSKHTAQIVAPWYLPSGERDQEQDVMTQGEFATHIGKSQGTVSKWLQPVKDEHKLRSSIVEFCQSQVPDDEDIERIDRIENLLTGRTDEFDHVIAPNSAKEQLIANEFDSLSGFNLRELENVVEKAVEGGWKPERMLQYIEKNYAHTPSDTVPDGVETGMVGGDDFELGSGGTAGGGSDGGTTTESGSGGVSVDDVDVGESDEGNDSPDWTQQKPEVDWDEVVDESELNRPLDDITRVRMLNEPLEDEAAIGINVLAEKYDMTPREVMRDFVDPIVADAVLRHLKEE